MANLNRIFSLVPSSLLKRHNLDNSSLIVLLIVREIAHAVPQVRRRELHDFDAEISPTDELEESNSSCH